MEISDFSRTIRPESGKYRIAQGRYRIGPELLDDVFRYVPNNKSGLKRILFNLDGVRDCVIDGGGTELIMRGGLTPFCLRNARRVTLRNIAIDWERPLYSAGVITAVGDDWIDLEFPASQPARLRGEQLFFYGEDYDNSQPWHMLEFDTIKHETAYKVDDELLKATQRFRELGANRFRMIGVELRPCPQIGNTMVFSHELRYNPGFIMDNCADVTLENIKLHHAGGMGVNAVNCRNIYLKNVEAVPSEGRIFSLPADSAHFVDCSGDILLDGCRFENQMDDALNVHGITYPVARKLSGRALLLRMGAHPEQIGVQTIFSGDTIGVYDANSLECLAERTVAEARAYNNTRLEIVLTEALPELDRAKLAVMRHCHDANLIVSNGYFAGNRARGLLISTLGKVLIEHNYFHVPGAAVLIAGDALSWFESGPVEDIEICGNFFDNCNFGPWGRALFDIIPEIVPELRKNAFHRNIRIHDNKIKAFHKPLLYARCVSGLSFENNTVIASSDYPQSGAESPEMIFDGAVNQSI